MLMRRPMLPNKVSTLGMRWVIWAAFRNNKTESSMNHKTQSNSKPARYGGISPCSFHMFPLVIQLSKAGRDNAAKECWAVAAALLRAARLLTPPHRIQELELQAGMEQNPQKKRSTLCRGRRWWEPTLHGAQRSKVGRHAARRHSPLYVLQKKTVNSPKHAGGETKQWNAIMKWGSAWAKK